MRLYVPTAILAIGVLAACDGTTVEPTQRTIDLDFTSSRHGWTARFADYAVGRAEDMELRSGHEALPQGVARTGRGLFIAGTNLSDDLFMFWKGRGDGLAPNTRYRVDVEVEFATEAPSGCAGIGGAPGEAVYVKVGATTVEPERRVEQVGGRDYYRLNIDKSNQSSSGEDAVVIGNVGNNKSGCTNPVWEMKTLGTDQPLEVTTGSDGSAWLMVGTDSGFEGRTRLYYTRYRATFNPL